MKTLLLDRTLWDLCLDAHGDIAVASEPYAIAQDVASACRLFKGECWYDTSKGVPYLRQSGNNVTQEILGKQPPLSVVKANLQKAALTVPGTVSAVVFISQVDGREVVGQVQVKSSTGTTVTLSGNLNSPTPV